MTPLSANPIFQAVQNDYPFPLAFVLKTEALDATTPREQVEGLIRLSNTALRYAALVAASNYSAAPFKDEKVSHRFERLKRPLVSDFANFMRVGVPAIEEQNGLFVPELSAAVATAGTERVRALRMGERGLEERELSLMEALVNLRNALFHERYRGQWKAFVEAHAPLVARFLEVMEWCARYPLLRVVSEDEWVRLAGAQHTFTPEPIPQAAREEVARARREGEFTGLLLADPSLTRFLTLYPFVLWADCLYCEQEPLYGLTEEVFLFNGDEGRRYIAYVGIRHPLPMRQPKERVEQLYAEKEVPPEAIAVKHLNYPVLYDRASRQSEMWLRENIIARRYIPQVYYPRKEMESEIEAFLRGSRTGFLLLGEAGMGKTNLLCSKVEQWREQGEVVMFYAGHQLSADISLEDRITRDLHVTGDFLELLQLLVREERRLILVVDGVNETPEAPALLSHLCAFAARYARADRTLPIKVIFSFRSAFFQKTLQALFSGGGDEASLFPSQAFQTHAIEEQGRRVESHRFTLERVDKEELEAIYEGYREYEGRADYEGRIMRFRPLASFASLSLTVRGVLLHPWYLRMVMEAYDGRAIPATLWTGEILKAFCDAKIYGRSDDERERFAGRADLVEELVSLLRRSETDIFRRDDLHDLSPRWSYILLEHEVARSPYLQLVDEGVLMEVAEIEMAGRHERARYHIRFAFDPLFEYLLSEDILREAGGWQNLTGERLASLLEEGKEFDHLTGAAEMLLTESAQEGNYALPVATLNAAEMWTAAPVFVRALITLEGTQRQNFEPLLDAVAGGVEGEKALTVLIKASYEFGEKQRFRPTLACAERAERAGRRLVEEEGRSELANDLAAALMNKGVALRGLGRLGEAIASYDDAIAIRRRLVEEEGRSELANDLAAALMNKGVALEQQEQWQEALACYNEGIGIWERMVEAGMAHMTPDLVKGLGVRLDLMKRFEEWEAAASDVACALSYAEPLLQMDSPPEPMVREFVNFIGQLRALTEDEREQVYAALGDWAETVRNLIEGDGE